MTTLNYDNRLEYLLSLTIKEQASDLHISVGHPPILRIAGRLVPLTKDRTIKDKKEKLSWKK